MSIFNENGNYINLKDPLERMPYVMQEINMICTNYDYITEGALDNIKNAIKKAWLKFKTFIIDALRSIKIKISDNTNKLLKYIEKNKDKVDEILKGKSINSAEILNMETFLHHYNRFNLNEVMKDNEDKNNTELLAIIRGKLAGTNEPIDAENFIEEFIYINAYSFVGIKYKIPNSTVLIKRLKEYQNMIKSIDSAIKTTEQDKILEVLNKNPNLDFTNGIISIYNILLSNVIKTLNGGIKDIMNAFNGKNNIIKDATEE